MIKLGKLLGEGVYGTVHLGIDSVQGTVAVKTPKKQDDETEEGWERRKLAMRDEGARLVQATHENVVKVYHLEQTEDGLPRLVMEYCEGGSLQAEYETGPMSLQHVRDIGTDVTLGLRAIHARDMLHRDIKPSNLLRDAKGRAKIGDFGLVTDDIVHGYGGSTAYGPHMAKEVWESRVTSKRSDVWALGMTIYKLLHGEDWCEETLPFWGEIADGGFARKLVWLPHVPMAWRRVINKCLHDDMGLRYQSADAVLSALAKLPIMPAWSCTLLESGVKWATDTDNRRRIEVTWTHSPRKEESWEAVSYPIGKGRRMRLGSSTSWKTSSRELDRFFEARVQ